MENYKELINRIDEEQIIDLLRDNGAPPVKVKENEIWFQTICHGGDSHKLCYFRDTKTFNCYTNCGAMNLVEFVSHLFKISNSQAYFFLDNKYCREGFKHTSSSKRIDLNFSTLEKYKDFRNRQKQENLLLPECDGSILKFFDENTFYQGWYDEGISLESMIKFGIRWYEVEKYIIIPHYNSEGKLVGIRRRSLQEKDKKNKYTPLMMKGLHGELIEYSHSLGMNLYGLYENKKNIEKTKQVIIVEAEKSVLKADTYYNGQSCVVATCGFNITSFQSKMLLKMKVEEIILGFDKDFDLDWRDKNKGTSEYEKYYSYVEKIFNMALKIAPFTKVYILWDKKNELQIKDSPLDEGKEIYEHLLADKIPITTESNIKELLMWRK